MASGKQIFAKKILDERRPYPSEQFVYQTYTLTSDTRLVSKVISLTEREKIAFKLLLGILKYASPFPLPEKKEEKESKLPAVAGDAATEQPEKPSEKERLGYEAPTEKAPVDYYSVLGVDKNATPQEIKTAFRNLMKEKHPDVLRSKGLSDSEMAEVTSEVQDIIFAYTVLKNQASRQDYNDYQKEFKKEAVSPPTPAEIATPIAINIEPTKKTGLDTSEKVFVKDVVNTGLVELSAAEQSGISGLLPQSFNNEQLTTSLLLYSKGVSSKQLESAIDGSSATSKLTDEQKQSLYAIPYLVAVFEDYDPQRSINLQQVEQTVTFQEVSVGTFSSQTRIVFDTTGNTVRPIVDKLFGKGIAEAKGKIKDFAFNAIKQSGNKFAKAAVKKGASLAAKKGASLAIKAGVSEAIGATIGTALGGPLGTVVGTAVASAVSWVADNTIGLIKKGFSKISEILTGEKDKRKQLAYLAGAGAVISFGLGFVIPAAFLGLTALGATASFMSGAAVGSGVVGAFVASFVAITTMSVGAFIAPLLGIVIVTPFIIALILFIINSGAYVVPRYVQAGGLLKSAYIGVEKVAKLYESADDPQTHLEFENSILDATGSITVQYTIRIFSKMDTLSNIRFDWNCSVIVENYNLDCPEYRNVTVNGESADNVLPPDAPTIISSVEDFIITYTMQFNNGTFDDTLTTDVFAVTADVEGVVTDEQAASSASVRIGNPPDTCPYGWPVQSGYITQGPQTTSSHFNSESIDIGLSVGNPVTARHSGVAILNAGTWHYGCHVDIQSVCNGEVFYSRYGHLSSTTIGPGPVKFGDVIGESGGDTEDGVCGGKTSGPHLHYEFRDVPGGSGGKIYLTDPPPYMEAGYNWGGVIYDFIPRSVPRGCVENCNMSIP